MRLVACQRCHAHIDVTQVAASTVRCACGTAVENKPPEALDLPIHRCAACGAGVATDATTCGYCRAGIVRDPSRLGLVCPECFARTVEGGRHCVSCGIEIRPCAVGGADEALACPVCESPLHVVTAERVSLYECGSCAGTWVPAADFDTIVERVAASTAARPSEMLARRPWTGTVRAADRVIYRRCPSCRQFMHRRNFGRSSGVVIDWCRAHGVWLDPDELSAVAAFVRRGGLVRDAPSAIAMPETPALAEADESFAKTLLRLLS